MLMFELYAFRLRPSGFGATSLPLGFGVTRPSPKVKLNTKIVRLPPTLLCNYGATRRFWHSILK
jgi:hypothetical protein